MSIASTSTVKLYRYSTEITQMCFVFGEPKEPEEEAVQCIEDIIKAHLAELVNSARSLALRRGARTLDVEDLIFLIRHERAKVNRLRVYLGWKDVRKKAKDNEGADEGPDIEVMEESTTTEKTSKNHKMHVKIPWEISNIFGEHVKEDSDDEEEEVEAYEDSKKLLKAADDLTKEMTKEQYQHYSECRQASFTYRKAKRFREFVHTAALVDGNESDEVMDVLGFLAYEMVRSLCESASQSKRSTALSLANKAVREAREAQEIPDVKGKQKEKRSLEGDEATAETETGESTPGQAMETSTVTPMANKKVRIRGSRSTGSFVRPNAAPRPELVAPTSLFSVSRIAEPATRPSASKPGLLGEKSSLGGVRSLQVEELKNGIGLNRGQRNGMRNWRSGHTRPRA